LFLSLLKKLSINSWFIIYFVHWLLKNIFDLDSKLRRIFFLAVYCKSTYYLILDFICTSVNVLMQNEVQFHHNLFRDGCSILTLNQEGNIMRFCNNHKKEIYISFLCLFTDCLLKCKQSIFLFLFFAFPNHHLPLSHRMLHRHWLTIMSTKPLTFAADTFFLFLSFLFIRSIFPFPLRASSSYTKWVFYAFSLILNIWFVSK